MATRDIQNAAAECGRKRPVDDVDQTHLGVRRCTGRMLSTGKQRIPDATGWIASGGIRSAWSASGWSASGWSLSGWIAGACFLAVGSPGFAADPMSVRRLPTVHRTPSGNPLELPISTETAFPVRPRIAATTADVRPEHETPDEHGQKTLGVPADISIHSQFAGTIPASQSARMHEARSQRLLTLARSSHRRRAMASAESSAWSALASAADAADASGQFGNGQQRTAAEHLATARRAIEESWDFVGIETEDSATAIARHMRSHKTRLAHCEQAVVAQGTPRQAADRYLNVARLELIPLATFSESAAEALNVLAYVLVDRNRSQTDPSATALCLRRAAAAGQPQDLAIANDLSAHLAQVGLQDEAQWVNDQYRRSIDSSNRSQIASEPSNMNPRTQSTSNPQWNIEQLTPAEFAAVSIDVVGSHRKSTQASSDTQRSSNPQPSQIGRSEQRSLRRSADGASVAGQSSGTVAALPASFQLRRQTNSLDTLTETVTDTGNLPIAPDMAAARSVQTRPSLLKRITHRIRHPFATSEKQ